MPSDQLTGALADAAADPDDSTAIEPAADVDAGPKQYRGITDMLEDPDAWQRKHLLDALPPDVNPDRYIASCITAARKSPAVREMGASADGRRSILAAMTRCAELGLEVNNDLQHAYLVPFKLNRGKKNERWELQLIIGYRGYLKLAGETGQLASIDVHEVYTGDEFSIVYGTGPDAGIVHKPMLCRDDGTPLQAKEERGVVYAYYGIIKFLDGGYHFTHMTLLDIDDRKQRSGAVAAGARTPWDTDPIPMARKTVVRAMVPFMRLGTRAALAVADDEKVVGADGELEFLDTTGTETEHDPQAGPPRVS